MKFLPENILRFVLIFAAFSLAGCNWKSEQKQTKAETALINVRDFRGKELHLAKPSERAICLIESALSGIYMLGAKNQVAGISNNVYSTEIFPFYAALDERIKNKTLPAPGNWDFVSIENVVSLRPDLVIIWASQEETIKNLEQFDIPVYAVMLNNLDDIYKEIEDFGLIFNKKTRSDSLIHFTKENLKSIQNITEKQITKTVYFAWAQGITETSGTNSLVNDMIQHAGCSNVCTKPDEHVVVNLERIIDWNPDAIILWNSGHMDSEDVLRTTSLKNVAAVKSGAVFELNSPFEYDLWTLKIQFASLQLAAWLYPDEITPGEAEKSKKEIFQFLYNTGTEFDYEK